MDMPAERMPDVASPAYDDLDPSVLGPLDPTEALDLHRAINERRAQMENPEMLRRLRSL